MSTRTTPRANLLVAKVGDEAVFRHRETGTERKGKLKKASRTGEALMFAGHVVRNADGTINDTVWQFVSATRKAEAQPDETSTTIADLVRKYRGTSELVLDVDETYALGIPIPRAYEVVLTNGKTYPVGIMELSDTQKPWLLFNHEGIATRHSDNEIKSHESVGGFIPYKLTRGRTIPRTSLSEAKVGDTATFRHKRRGVKHTEELTAPRGGLALRFAKSTVRNADGTINEAEWQFLSASGRVRNLYRYPLQVLSDVVHINGKTYPLGIYEPSDDKNPWLLFNRESIATRHSDNEIETFSETSGYVTFGGPAWREREAKLQAWEEERRRRIRHANVLAGI